MIVCSSCLHHNPDPAAYCEACGDRLPESKSCPNCSSPVQDKAHFCGQCGFNLRLSVYSSPAAINAKGTNSDVLLPEPFPPEPILDLALAESGNEASSHLGAEQEQPKSARDTAAGDTPMESVEALNTQIQKQVATLLHLQSDTLIELPESQKDIHLGKPNDRVPPDINMSTFPNAEVVSRVHAVIHVEGAQYFVEDLGSANGTYLNNTPLASGTRYRLRVGDRVSLGKGELVTFIFKI
ncbi:MAG: FHA domain-containing protein [Thermosynechococcaceae cyanobacterium]